MLKRGLLLIGLTLMANTAAKAAPVDWTLSGTFDDGGTASGTFTYDADTDTWSNFNLTTTAGSTLPGASYNTSIGSGGTTLFAISPGADFLSFRFDDGGGTPLSELPNGGGVFNILIGAGSDELSSAFIFRRFTSGTVTSQSLPAPVPEPSTVLLLGTGLIGLVGYGYRRHHAA